MGCTPADFHVFFLDSLLSCVLGALWIRISPTSHQLPLFLQKHMLECGYYCLLPSSCTVMNHIWYLYKMSYPLFSL